MISVCDLTECDEGNEGVAVVLHSNEPEHLSVVALWNYITRVHPVTREKLAHIWTCKHCLSVLQLCDSQSMKDLEPLVH
jgi:hypothetical protein